MSRGRRRSSAAELEKHPYWISITAFSERARKALPARTVILYGSMARGDFHQGSDADILVICDSLPRNFLKRQELLDRLAPAELPLEALAYTPAEFETMTRERHPTALSALEDGLVLYDDGFYREARKLYRLVRDSTGLRRTEIGWVAEKLPPNRD